MCSAPELGASSGVLGRDINQEFTQGFHPFSEKNPAGVFQAEFIFLHCVHQRT